MSQTATNPETGERFVLVNGQWVPMTQTATNPDTGEKFGLAGNQWVPLSKAAAPAPAPAAAAAAPTEEEGVLSALGRAVERNVPSFRKNVARVVEEAPELLASLYSSLPGTGTAFAPLVKGLGAAAAQSETYKGLTGEAVASERAAAEKKLAEIGGRKYKGFFEEEGIGRKLGSLAETVAESALPVAAGVATGLATRSPVAAGLVMGVGNAPATYGGIRERQEAAGIRNIDQALLGTAASSALDVLTGVGGKVLSGTAAIAAKELLEAGLKQAATRVVKSAGEESVTESLQNVIEQVAGGTNPLTKKAMLETLEAGLAGALGGTVFTGATEVAAAPFRPRDVVTREGIPVAPEVRQEFQRLAAREVAAVMAADPQIDQKAAVDIVSERAEELLTQAASNVAGAEGGADVTPDVGAGLDVSEGAGAGVAPNLEPTPAEAGAPELGKVDTGRLGEPVPSVPVADVGEGAGVGTLAPAPEVAAPTVAPAFDITPIMEAPNRKERVSVASQIISDIAMANPELQALPKKVYTQAANQMATAASRGEQFDPLDIMYKVAGVERPAPTAAVEPAAAPELPTPPAPPSVDEVAVAPVKAAIEATTTPAPVVSGAVPNLAQSAAREVGITPAAPEVATPEPPKVARDFRAAIKMESGAVYAGEPGQTHFDVYEANPNLDYDKMAPEGDGFVDNSGKFYTRKEAAATLGRTGKYNELYVEDFDATEEELSPPAQKTLNDLVGVGTVNPENTNEVLVEGGGIQLTPVSPNIVQLDSLRAVEKGGGRKAMQQLIRAADDNGTAIQLSPEPFAAPAGKEMTPTELSDWYAGFGFEAQPDGTMVRPASAPPSATITPEAAATPQEVIQNIERFARSEAEDRGFDPGMFGEGARDVARGVEPLPDNLILEGQGQDALDAYKAGMEFGRERLAEAQAAPAAAPTTAPAAPAAPTAPTAPAAPAAPTAPAAPAALPLTTANVDAAISVKLTKGQIKRLEEAAGIRRMKLSAMQKRITQSRTSAETMSLAGKLMLIAKNPDTDVNLLTSLFNSVPPPVLGGVLSFLDTNDVVRLAERAGMANPARINAMVRDEYIPYINRLMQRASRLSEEWAEFTGDSPEGADAMADVMFYSNMVDADPTLAPSAAEYLKIDPTYQDLTARYNAEKDPQKKSNLKGQVTKRRDEIRRLYFGGEDLDPTGNPVEVKGWNNVPPKGKQIFRKARDHYREDFKEHYRLLMERIDDAGFDEETTDRLKASVDDMFADAMKRAIYFPMKRFGEYWVSIGKGASGEFHMFESYLSQQAFIARRRLSGDIRSISSGFGRDSLRKLRGQVSDASTALKSILDIIDDGKATDPDLLKDSVFQMYLSSLPEADMRRRFIHRQFKTGFSTDVLRTFATTAVASANQLGRLAYNGKLNNLIDQSYAETEENPSKPRLDAITDELKKRLGITLSGDAETLADRAANGFAKGTFLWLLSAPKSAFMNLTQLHLTGFPTLTAEFGEAATVAMAARYTGQLLTGQRIALAVRDENGNVKLSAPNFTAQSSAYIRSLKETDPDRYEAMQRAWLYGEEREVTQSTFTSAQSLYERSGRPTSELGFSQALRAGDQAQAVKQAVSNTIDGMGALFHHSERIGREIMYMSAFELAYDRNLKQGMKPEPAADAAMALAVKLTNDGMFDFSNWNKPRAFKTPVGRVALQMRSYSFQMTSLLVRSAFNLIAAQRTKAQRLAAARVFFGVGGMTTLYAGFRSSQFYMMALLGYGIYKFFEGFGDDDEEEKETAQGFLTPETIERELMKFADEQGRELTKKDLDYFIRTVWIPETFKGNLQDVFGLSDETAAKLARAADIGLPSFAGVDISNSVALTSLWHPVDTKSDDPEAQKFEALGRMILGPSGSFITVWNKFDEETNKGNFDRAIEAILPAAVRNYVKSERLQEEGLRIGKNQDILLRDPSFYDAYVSTVQALGFPEAETSRAMQLDIKAGEIEREVGQERTDLLDRRYRAILDTATDTTGKAEQKLREVERAIQIYNLNYPSNAIDEDTKERSFQQKQQEAAERMYGMGFNAKIPIRQPLAEERAGE